MRVLQSIAQRDRLLRLIGDAIRAKVRRARVRVIIKARVRVIIWAVYNTDPTASLTSSRAFVASMARVS